MSTGRRDLFIDLLDAHKRIIYKIVHSYCRDQEDRKDLEQEIIVQLWKSFHKYDTSYKFSTWMYRIALNVAISAYRKEKGRQSRRAVYQEESLCQIRDEEKYEKTLDDNIAVLQRFINQQNELNKALMLLYLDERKYEEIAEILGISTTNVATKLSRLKLKLKKEFQKSYYHGSN